MLSEGPPSETGESGRSREDSYVFELNSMNSSSSEDSEEEVPPQRTSNGNARMQKKVTISSIVLTEPPTNGQTHHKDTTAKDTTEESSSAHQKPLNRQSSRKRYLTKAFSVTTSLSNHLPESEKLKEEFLRTCDPSLIIPETERVLLQWKNLKYTVPLAKKSKFGRSKLDATEEKQKYILKDVNGFGRTGSLLAIIGPSGAGKTSLLNVLARKIQSKNITGEMLLNEEKAVLKEFREVTGFVAQEDILLGSLTPREALNFAAKLKLPATISDADKSKRVEALLASMGLSHVGNNFIGYSGAAARNSGIKRGLSGGERKRVSICMELINDPKLIFLDEPTSGLDSYAAKAVMESLKKLTWMGRTVICQTVYFGQAGSHVMGYFSGIGYKCPKFINPADYLMKILQVPKGVDEEEDDGDQEQGLKNATPEQVNTLITAFQNHNLSTAAQNAPVVVRSDKKTKSPSAAGIPAQFLAIMQRSFKNQSREPLLFKARLGQTISTALLAGLIYLRQPYDQLGIADRTAAMFFIIVSQAFAGLNGPTYLFPNERGVFFRERSAGMYSTLVYFLAKVCSELPLNIIVPLFNCCIAFWMVGFNDSFVGFVIYTVICVSTANTAYSLGLCLSCWIKDPGLVVKLQPMILLPFMLFSGFFLNSDSVPNYFIWLEHISFMKYAFGGAAHAIFEGQEFHCRDNELREVTNSTERTCPQTRGEQVITRLGVDLESWENIIVLNAMTIIYYTLSFFGLFFSKVS